MTSHDASIFSKLAHKNILITGADGFIGSHLTEQLVKAGANVTALSHYNAFDHNGWLDTLPPEVRENLNIIKGDIRDEGQTRRISKGQNYILHLAALIAIPYSYHAPQSYVDVNVKGTTNVLEAAREFDTERVIVTSTSEVYGTAITTPMPESHPLQAQSPYAASKIAADMMAASYYKSFETPAVILRPFNTFGPRQSERAVISSMIRQLTDNRINTIKLGNLEPRRDFTFVEDTARAFMYATVSDQIEYATPYNAGNGKAVSIGDLLNILRDLTGQDKPVSQSDDRFRPDASEVMHLECDPTIFKTATGWEPTVSLKEGLKKTIEWRKSRPASASFEYAI